MCNHCNGVIPVLDFLYDSINKETEEGDVVLCIDCVRKFSKNFDLEENTYTPLHIVCGDVIIIDNLEEVLECFSYGDSINRATETGITPLHCLAYRCRDTPNGGISNFKFWSKKTTLKFLLNKGADLYKKDKNGITPYDIFMESKDENIKKIIIDYTLLDIKIPDK